MKSPARSNLLKSLRFQRLAANVALARLAGTLQYRPANSFTTNRADGVWLEPPWLRKLGTCQNQMGRKVAPKTNLTESKLKMRQLKAAIVLESEPCDVNDANGIRSRTDLPGFTPTGAGSQNLTQWKRNAD